MSDLSIVSHFFSSTFHIFRWKEPWHRLKIDRLILFETYEEYKKNGTVSHEQEKKYAVIIVDIFDTWHGVYIFDRLLPIYKINNSHYNFGSRKSIKIYDAKLYLLIYYNYINNVIVLLPFLESWNMKIHKYVYIIKLYTEKTLTCR